MIRSILIPTVAALAVATVAAPAAAEATRYVTYGDLDVSSSAGQAALRDRVSTAVNQVCGKAEPRDIHSREAVETCRTDTWAVTEPQLNAVFGRPTVKILADARIAIGQADPVLRPRG